MEEKFVPAAEPAAVQPAPAAPLPVQPTGKKSGNFSVLMLIAGIVLGIYVISLIIPFIWSLLTSFKGRYEFDDNIFGLPQTWTIENFVTVFNAFAVRVESGAGFRTVFLEEMFLYSILYAVGCAIAARRPLPPPAPAPGAGLLSGPVNAGFNRFARDPKGFAVSPGCIHCGRCLAGCPTGNITEQAGRITFGPDCWFCLACLHNCPVHAIDWRGKGARNGFYTFPAELEG